MTGATAPGLALDDVWVHYRGAPALFGVSLDIGSGRTRALLGANGAGKSSLAKAVAGFVPVSQGRIRLDGRDITGAGPRRRSREGIAYVPEGGGTFPSLTVLDNLRMGLRYTLPKAERPDAMDQVFDLFPRLAERSRQIARTLSGGEQRMLSLARVLVSRPKLMIADELSLGLAPVLLDQIYDVLHKAADAGVTILLIEQFVDRALTVADDITVLRKGEVAWEGTTDDPEASAVIDRILGGGSTLAPTV